MGQTDEGVSLAAADTYYVHTTSISQQSSAVHRQCMMTGCWQCCRALPFKAGRGHDEKDGPDGKPGGNPQSRGPRIVLLGTGGFGCACLWSLGGSSVGLGLSCGGWPEAEGLNAGFE